MKNIVALGFSLLPFIASAQMTLQNLDIGFTDNERVRKRVRPFDRAIENLRHQG